MATLTGFRNRIGYGIRPNLFQVTIPSTPTGLTFTSQNTDFTFLCRSAGIPASTLGTVEVPFRGRVIKLPGDRTFEAWTVTVFADQNLQLRNYFESWMNQLNEHRSGGGQTTGYTATLQVDQLARGTNAATDTDNTTPHNIVKSYQFLNAFPSNIAQIDLSYDNNNSIAEYTVEFQYDYWTLTSNGTVGTGDLIQA
jgi:hypothetical protein